METYRRLKGKEEEQITEAEILELRLHEPDDGPTAAKPSTQYLNAQRGFKPLWKYNPRGFLSDVKRGSLSEQ